MKLANSSVAALRAVFSQPTLARHCMKIMTSMNLANGSMVLAGSGFDSGSQDALNALAGAGLINKADGRVSFTAEGAFVSDSFRECHWLLERENRLHGYDKIPAMVSSEFTGDVLEVGSGFGCNLVSLAPYAQRRVGLDVIEVYLQLSGMLSEFCGVTPPEMIAGSGDHLPFANESFDHVLMCGSMQYLPMPQAFKEAHRVLRPGGRAVVVVGYWMAQVRDTLEALGQGSLRGAISGAVTCLESALYELTLRRFNEFTPGEAMPRTIFPRVGFLKRLAERSGFEIDPVKTVVWQDELYLVLHKRPAST